MGWRITLSYCFDIYRFLFGSIITFVILLEQTAERKEHFGKRILFVTGLAILFGIIYPIARSVQMTDSLTSVIVISALSVIWWCVADAAVLAFVAYCYKVTIAQLLYYGILALAIQEFITIVLQYVCCKLLFPSIQTEHPVYYLVLLLIIYGIFEWIAYRWIAIGMIRKHTIEPPQNYHNLLEYFLIWLMMTLVNDVSSGFFEWATEESPLGGSQFFQHIAVPVYCVFVSMLFCTVVIILQVLMYDMAEREQEKKLLLLMQKEKEQQYQFTRENIDLINAKCHDLKHQIRALQSVREEERRQLFAETEKAIDFYGSAVKTGSEVLDTILTEKGIQCTRYGIRLSCNVQSANVDKIHVIDLYTILGNALDNAIECVNQYEETEKKIISFSVMEKGNMLMFFVDNYFDGELQIKEGIPVTSKDDGSYHGFGVKSIRMVAKKYGGDIRITTQNQTFSLQILLEIS
jgi:hypothetical protein